MAVRDSESYHRGLRLLFFCENGSAGRWHGYIRANAGIDTSNTSEGEITLLSQDPDHSAARIHDYLEKQFGVQSAVIVADTFRRTWWRALFWTIADKRTCGHEYLRVRNGKRIDGDEFRFGHSCFSEDSDDVATFSIPSYCLTR